VLRCDDDEEEDGDGDGVVCGVDKPDPYIAGSDCGKL